MEKNTVGFYLASNESPFSLRWTWCDEVETRRTIGHTGWFTNDFQDDKIRGVVFNLSHQRGFLAGWSMGENMASAVDIGTVYLEQASAAYAADSMAERVAEGEREHEEKYQAAQKLEDSIDTAFARLRECLALRNSGCFQHLRDEAHEIMETIRTDRARLTNEFAGVL